MAPITWYLLPSLVSGTEFLTLQEGAAPTTATFSPNTGWTVTNVNAALTSEMVTQAIRAAGSFGAGDKPASLITTAGSVNAFRSPAYTGKFPASDWSFNFGVTNTAGNAVAANSFRFRIKVYKSSNASGASATLISASTILSDSNPTQISANNNGPGIVPCTWSAPAINLNNEYMFIALAAETITGYNNNGRNIILRQGTSYITTPDLQPPTYELVGMVGI